MACFQGSVDFSEWYFAENDDLNAALQKAFAEAFENSMPEHPASFAIGIGMRPESRPTISLEWTAFGGIEASEPLETLLLEAVVYNGPDFCGPDAIPAMKAFAAMLRRVADRYDAVADAALKD